MINTSLMNLSHSFVCIKKINTCVELIMSHGEKENYKK